MSLPSETSALLSTASSDVLRDQLKKACGGDGKLQKSEFKVLLLGQGISIKQAAISSSKRSCVVKTLFLLQITTVIHTNNQKG